MNLQLHKELYFFEWNRKEQLASSTGTPVGLTTVLVGGVVFLARNFPYAHNYQTAVFLALVVAVVLSLMAAIYFLGRSMYGYWYEQIPTSDKLQKYFDELQQYHNSIGSAPEQPQSEFDRYLQERLAEATTVNRRNNTRTGGALHKATGAVICALIFAGMSLVPYLEISVSRNASPPRVEIGHPTTEKGGANAQGEPATGSAAETPGPSE